MGLLFPPLFSICEMFCSTPSSASSKSLTTEPFLKEYGILQPLETIKPGQSCFQPQEAEITKAATQRIMKDIFPHNKKPQESHRGPADFISSPATL